MCDVIKALKYSNINGGYLLSVAVVTFNAGKSLRETLDSFISQDYERKELIIVDGNSTDNTCDILQEYNRHITKWISEPDKGIYDAMNKALQLASGDFILFLGADDIFYSKHVLTSVANCIKGRNIIYYGNIVLKQTNVLVQYWKHFYKWRFYDYNLSHQSIFYPKIVYKNYKYNTKYKVYADYAYNLDLVKTFKFRYIDVIVSYYATDGFSSSVQDDEFSKVKFCLIKQKIGWLNYYIGKLYRYCARIKFNINK